MPLKQGLFDPLWMRDQSDLDRREIVDWLQNYHVDPEHCASFEISGDEVHCKMYALNEQGKPFIDPENDYEAAMGPTRVFVPKAWPMVLDA